MVAPAVITSTNASERVEKSTARTLWTSTIRTAVSMSTPASAASGIRATSDPPTSTTSTRTSEWTMAETRVRAPARTLTAVRAIAPVAGMPPKSGDARLARPCPNSSRSGSCRPVSDIPSATFAESRLSIAASRATANAAPKSSRIWPAEIDGQRRHRERIGQRADARQWPARDLGDHGRGDDREQRRRQRPVHARRQHHDGDGDRHDRERGAVRR